MSLHTLIILALNLGGNPFQKHMQHITSLILNIWLSPYNKTSWERVGIQKVHKCMRDGVFFIKYRTGRYMSLGWHIGRLVGRGSAFSSCSCSTGLRSSGYRLCSRSFGRLNWVLWIKRLQIERIIRVMAILREETSRVLWGLQCLGCCWQA